MIRQNGNFALNLLYWKTDISCEDLNNSLLLPAICCLMIKMKHKLIFFGVIVLLTSQILSSCKDKIEYQDIEGNWTLIRAMRNGKPTQTLENVFFEFNPENRMMTNLLGIENTFDIVYKYPVIEIKNGSDLEELTVKKMEEDTLHLELRIINYKYDFYLMRSESN
jgi:hypothetical protein